MKLRALLEICRVSNLPTVWSNVTAGSSAGAYVTAFYISETNQVEALKHELWILGQFILIPMFSISCLYCAGMVLNDYWDREIDSIERPDRPIPSGRVSPGYARNIAVMLLFAGICFPLFHLVGNLLVSGPGIDLSDNLKRGLPMIVATTLLVGCIIAYNRLHTKSATSVVLMAACRVLAILTAACFFAPWPMTLFTTVFIAGPALSVGGYTLLITIVARREVEDVNAAKPRRFSGPKTVMNMIAGMPLIDAAWLALMGLWPASLFCVACAGLTKFGHRKVAGS